MAMLCHRFDTPPTHPPRRIKAVQVHRDVVAS